jgi:putative transposase
MSLADLLEKDYNDELDEYWERERTATPIRAFAVWLHATGCSLGETGAILASLGVERSHQVIFQWIHRLTDISSDSPTASPSRVGIDETTVRINGGQYCVFNAINFETKLILDAQIFARHGTDPAAAFLHRLRENHDCSNTTFLTDLFGCRAVIPRLGLSGRVDYTDRNLIEKWFHTLKQRIGRFHHSWVGSRRSARRLISYFAQ